MRRRRARRGALPALLAGCLPLSAAADPWAVLDQSAATAGAGSVFEVQAPAGAAAEVASSFDAGAEGWTVTDNGGTPLVHQVSGGHPGGFVSAEDGADGPLVHFSAPAAFLGDQSGMNGGTLSWDWLALGLDSANPDAGGRGLRLAGGGLTVDAGVGQPRTAGWTSESVTLVPSGFACVSGCSGTPSPAQLQTLLASLAALQIRGDWYAQSGVADSTGPNDTSGLDDVRLTGPPASPAPTAISAGMLLVDPFGLARETSGQLLVTDPNAAAGPSLIRVDPGSGAQSTVSSGGDLALPLGLALEAGGAAVIADAGTAGGAVVRVDTGSGAQSVVTSGGSLDRPVAIAVAGDGDLFVVNRGAYGAPGSVVEVDPGTGAQTPVTSAGNLVDPIAVAIDADGDLLVLDANAFEGRGGIVRVDPATGTQTVVASGRHFLDPTGLAIDTDGTLLVVDRAAGDELTGKGAVILVDPASGAQTLAASGPPFRDPVAIVPLPEPSLPLTLGAGLLWLSLLGRRGR